MQAEEILCIRAIHLEFRDSVHPFGFQGRIGADRKIICPAGGIGLCPISPAGEDRYCPVPCLFNKAGIGEYDIDCIIGIIKAMIDIGILWDRPAYDGFALREIPVIGDREAKGGFVFAAVAVFFSPTP